MMKKSLQGENIDVFINRVKMSSILSTSLSDILHLAKEKVML